jgi:hypothetical protein
MIRVCKEQFSYGHREILLNYIGLSNDYYFEAIFQHGVWQNGFSNGNNKYLDLKTPLNRFGKRIPLFTFSSLNLNNSLSNQIGSHHAIGAPWIYFLRDFKESKLNNSNHRYVVFPDHSLIGSEIQTSELDIQKKIEYWQSLTGGAELQICLYWVDFLNPVWQKVARNEGVELKTAGIGRTDPPQELSSSRINFLSNLFEIMSTATHCIFENLSSALFYASSLGLDVGIFRNMEDVVLSGSEIHALKYNSAMQSALEWATTTIPQTINRFAKADEIRPVVSEMLGLSNRLPAAELLSLLPIKRLSLT